MPTDTFTANGTWNAPANAISPATVGIQAPGAAGGNGNTTSDGAGGGGGGQGGSCNGSVAFTPGVSAYAVTDTGTQIQFKDSTTLWATYGGVGSDSDGFGDGGAGGGGGTFGGTAVTTGNNGNNGNNGQATVAGGNGGKGGGTTGGAGGSGLTPGGNGTNPGDGGGGGSGAGSAPGVGAGWIVTVTYQLVMPAGRLLDWPNPNRLTQPIQGFVSPNLLALNPPPPQPVPPTPTPPLDTGGGGAGSGHRHHEDEWRRARERALLDEDEFILIAALLG